MVVPSAASQVDHVQEVHADVSDSAARQALQWCSGSEDQTIDALADFDFKRRAQVRTWLPGDLKYGLFTSVALVFFRTLSGSSLFFP